MARNVSAVAGDRVWNAASKVRVRLGPLDYERFLDLLPDPAPTPQRKTFFSLAHLVRMYAGPELDVDVQLILKARDVPEARLLGCDIGASGSRLGWNAWLQSLPASTTRTTPCSPLDAVARLGGVGSGM